MARIVEALHLRIFRRVSAMSALGQKQTFAMQKGMSALPPKADMRSATWDVRFVPKADISRLFDHRVGPGEQLRWQLSYATIFHR